MQVAQLLARNLPQALIGLLQVGVQASAVEPEQIDVMIELVARFIAQQILNPDLQFQVSSSRQPCTSFMLRDNAWKACMIFSPKEKPHLY